MAINPTGYTAVLLYYYTLLVECCIEVGDLSKALNYIVQGIETSSIQYTQYKCSTCGKRHIAPVSKDVLYCPSCGAATLDKAMGVEYVPDGIIPFMINKEQALLCFKDWLKRTYNVKGNTLYEVIRNNKQ